MNKSKPILLTSRFFSDKLVIQNAKLRDQVTRLLEQLENYSLKFVSKKSDRYSQPHYEPDDELTKRDKLLKQKQFEIHTYTKELQKRRKQLKETYNID
jgi:hypothetical protein